MNPHIRAYRESTIVCMCMFSSDQAIESLRKAAHRCRHVQHMYASTPRRRAEKDYTKPLHKAFRKEHTIIPAAHRCR